LYFYRDTHGNEVDLIIKNQKQLIPVEIKSAATFTKDFLKGIEQFRNLVKNRCGNGYILYNGDDGFQLNNIFIQNILIHSITPLCAAYARTPQGG